MKWLGRPSPFHLFTNPCVINRFIFGQGVVIYYLYMYGCVDFIEQSSITQSNFQTEIFFIYNIAFSRHGLNNAHFLMQVKMNLAAHSEKQQQVKSRLDNESKLIALNFLKYFDNTKKMQISLRIRSE